MLDKPEKTRDLMHALKAALPIEVELTPHMMEQLRTGDNPILIPPRLIVSEVSYTGDEGGIVCHILPGGMQNVVIISITLVRMHRKHPLAAAVIDYQKHRVKKLKKQQGA